MKTLNRSFLIILSVATLNFSLKAQSGDKKSISKEVLANECLKDFTAKYKKDEPFFHLLEKAMVIDVHSWVYKMSKELKYVDSKGFVVVGKEVEGELINALLEELKKEPYRTNDTIINPEHYWGYGIDNCLLISQERYESIRNDWGYVYRLLLPVYFNYNGEQYAYLFVQRWGKGLNSRGGQYIYKIKNGKPEYCIGGYGGEG